MWPRRLACRPTITTESTADAWALVQSASVTQLCAELPEKTATQIAPFRCMVAKDIDKLVQAGKLPMHWAAQLGEGVHELLQSGADEQVHMKDGQGNTPLHLAALNNHR